MLKRSKNFIVILISGLSLLFPIISFFPKNIIQEFDYNTLIPIIMMLFLMFDPVYETFKISYIKKYLFFILSLQILLILSRVFLPSIYDEVFFNYYTYLIIVLLFFVVINKYFDFNLSQEFLLLKIDVNRLLNKDGTDSKIKALKKVFTWIRKNKLQSKSNKDKSYILIKKCIDTLMISNFSIIETNDNNIDQLYNELKKFYKLDKDNMQFVTRYFNLISSIIKKYDEKGNIKLSNKFIDLITEDIFQFELICDNEEHQLNFLEALFKLISDEGNPVILSKYLTNIRIEVLKFNFKLKTLPSLFIIQELVEIIIKNKNSLETKFVKEYKNFLASQLIQNKESDNLYLIRNSLLSKLINDAKLFDEFFDLIVTMIYSSNDIWTQNKSLIFIVNRFIDERLENEKIESEEYGKLFEFKIEILLKIENGYTYSLNSDILIKYLIHLNNNLNDETKKRVFNRIIKAINLNKDYQNYFLNELNEFTNESSFEISFSLFYQIVKRIYDPSTITNHAYFLAALDTYLEQYIKLKSIDHNYAISIEGNKDLNDILNTIKNKFSDEFTGKLIEITGEYLGNIIIGKEIFRFIFDEALTQIESNNGKIVKIASNRFGWHIFNSINTICETKNDHNNISKNIEKIIEFYKFVYKHLDDDIILFVGTLFIVNGIYFEYLISKHPNNNILKLIYSNNYIAKLKSLDCEIKLKLLESYNIRKYSMDKYITDEKEDRIHQLSKMFISKIESK